MFCNTGCTGTLKCTARRPPAVPNIGQNYCGWMIRAALAEIHLSAGTRERVKVYSNGLGYPVVGELLFDDEFSRPLTRTERDAYRELLTTLVMAEDDPEARQLECGGRS